MSVRDYINDHQLIFGVAGAVMLVGAVAYASRSLLPTRRTPPIQDYVEETTLRHRLFPVSEVPPVRTFSGTFVAAYYQSCGGCTAKQLVYLEKYTDEMKPQVQAIYESQRSGRHLVPELVMNLHKGLLVRLPASGSAWVAEDSKEGQQVISSLKCGAGAVATPCPP